MRVSVGFLPCFWLDSQKSLILDEQKFERTVWIIATETIDE